MEKIFESKMKEFCSSMLNKDQNSMVSHFEKMAEMCPCMGGKEMPEEDRKKMMEKMMSCCGGMMEKMSACFK